MISFQKLTLEASESKLEFPESSGSSDNSSLSEFKLSSLITFPNLSNNYPDKVFLVIFPVFGYFVATWAFANFSAFFRSFYSAKFFSIFFIFGISSISNRYLAFFFAVLTSSSFAKNMASYYLIKVFSAWDSTNGF